MALTSTPNDFANLEAVEHRLLAFQDRYEQTARLGGKACRSCAARSLLEGRQALGEEAGRGS